MMEPIHWLGVFAVFYFGYNLMIVADTCNALFRLEFPRLRDRVLGRLILFFIGGPVFLYKALTDRD